MVFNATFNNISVISWRSFLIVRGNLEYPEKTTDLPPVTDKLGEIRTHNAHFGIVKLTSLDLFTHSTLLMVDYWKYYVDVNNEKNKKYTQI